MLHWIFILANLGHLIFSKYYIKRLLDRDEWLSLFQFYRKTFLPSVDPEQPKNVKFLL